ncbi:hypothetical protein H8356DRAFT_1342655 [Neocallimastix lanati (nom. inval.)]|nr:hypothetical protein H8356DRAFT_1342655 [Neocallimastix sp. JGI-2020a]
MERISKSEIRNRNINTSKISFKMDESDMNGNLVFPISVTYLRDLEGELHLALRDASFYFGCEDGDCKVLTTFSYTHYFLYSIYNYRNRDDIVVFRIGKMLIYSKKEEEDIVISGYNSRFGSIILNSRNLYNPNPVVQQALTPIMCTSTNNQMSNQINGNYSQCLPNIAVNNGIVVEQLVTYMKGIKNYALKECLKLLEFNLL